MNVIDVIIVLLFITALLRGAERGVIRQFFATFFLLLGFFVGAYLQSKLIHLADTPADKAMLSLIIIACGVLLFGAAGEFIGSWVKRRVDTIQLRGLDRADRTVGSVTAGATSLLIIWLVAAVFSNIPIQSIRHYVRSSVIVAQLNRTLPATPKITSSLSHLIDPNGFPEVFTGLEPEINLDAPLPSLGDLDVAVQKSRASVVKIEGAGCGGISEGSGFVADANLVITNAHVIAGVHTPYLLDANGRHPVVVRWFDPDLDLAVLQVGNLAGQALPIRTDLAPRQTPGVVLGYPQGGEFSAKAATVLESFQAIGRNIYDQSNTRREVYSLKSTVEPGNSGGPLVDADGNVIGLVFARSAAYDNVGYALTMDAVQAGLNKAKEHTASVGTGNCAQ